MTDSPELAAIYKSMRIELVEAMDMVLQLKLALCSEMCATGDHVELCEKAEALIDKHAPLLADKPHAP